MDKKSEIQFYESENIIAPQYSAVVAGKCCSSFSSYFFFTMRGSFFEIVVAAKQALLKIYGVLGHPGES